MVETRAVHSSEKLVTIYETGVHNPEDHNPHDEELSLAEISMGTKNLTIQLSKRWKCTINNAYKL
jgi:hypothetical protein